MAIKTTGYDGGLGVFRTLRCSNRNKNHIQMDFHNPLILISMVGMRVDSVKKMKGSFEKAPANLKKSLGPRIPNAPKTLDGINVGLKFQFKMLRRW